jgi:hypothetical protein
MKKNLVLVSSVAGIVLLTGAITFTFAGNSDTLSWGKGNWLMQNRLGSGQGLGGMGMHRGEGRDEWMMFWPGMGDFGGKWPGVWSGMGMILNQQKQAMQTAIEKNDYSAYVTAYEKAKLTKEQFASMVKMHQAWLAIQTAIEKGDYTVYTAAVKGTAMEGKVTATQFTDMVAKHTQRAAERAAVTNNDYTAFLAAVKGTPMEGKVTQEQFTTMAKHEKEMGQTQTTTK